MRPSLPGAGKFGTAWARTRPENLSPCALTCRRLELGRVRVDPGWHALTRTGRVREVREAVPAHALRNLQAEGELLPALLRRCAAATPGEQVLAGVVGDRRSLLGHGEMERREV